MCNKLLSDKEKQLAEEINRVLYDNKGIRAELWTSFLFSCFSIMCAVSFAFLFFSLLIDSQAAGVRLQQGFDRAQETETARGTEQN